MMLMKTRLISVIQAIILLAVFSCQKKSAEVTSKLPLDWEALSDKIIERSQVQPGERVIMIALPGDFDPLVQLLSEKFPERGAEFLGTISVDSLSWPNSWKTDFIRSTMAGPKEDQWKLLDHIDLGIMLPGATPMHAPYATLQDALRQGVGRTIHFHWSGAFDFSVKPLAMDDEKNVLYQKSILETDYSKLSKYQFAFDSALRTDWIIVTTPKGTNLRFKIGDRPVTKQDGDASFGRTGSARNLIDREIELPAGVVRVAPLEETVEGVIALPDAQWSGQQVEGLVITFKEGLITDIKAGKGLDAVEAEIVNGGLAAESFREFALGFNPLLAIPEGGLWIPHYGYGAGVVRLSLGNNQELGGSVSQGTYSRNNFFTDATVMIGKDVWVKDGKLIK